jgi:hypothetical protein
MVLFQKCVRQFDPSTKMATTAELKKNITEKPGIYVKLLLVM